MQAPEDEADPSGDWWFWMESAAVEVSVRDEIRRYRNVYGDDWKRHFDARDLDEEER